MPSSELRLSREFQIIGVLNRSGNYLHGTIERSASMEYYTGEYTVTPSIEEQTLQTQNKMMSNDVVVEEIPYYETSNQYGGYTVIIG